MARISSYPVVTPKAIDTLIISQGYDIDADEPIEGNPTGSVTIGSVIDLVNTGLVPGTGTVTSLGVSMPSAFTVSNSPVTTAGVINITGSGTSAQYIDGTGSLQLSPNQSLNTTDNVAFNSIAGDGALVTNIDKYTTSYIDSNIYTKTEADGLFSSGFVGAISPTSSAPTQNGLYSCTQSGTYTNFGGEVVSLSNQVVSIAVEGAQNNVFSQIITPTGITFDSVPTSGSTNAVESGGVKTYADSKIKNNFDKTNVVDSASMTTIFRNNEDKKNETLNYLSKDSNELKINYIPVSGYISKTTGDNVVNASWENSSFIEVFSGDTVRRVGTTYNNTSGGNVAVMAFYDENKDLISTLIANVLSDETFDIDTYIDPSIYTGKKYIIATSTTAIPLELYVERNVDIEKIPKLKPKTDFTGNLRNGFVSDDGSFNSSSSWRSTEFVKVFEGELITYSTSSTGTVSFIVGFDNNFENPTALQPLTTGGQKNNLTYTILSDGYIVLNGLASSSLIELNISRYLWRYVSSNYLSESDYFMPSDVYGKSGDLFQINPYGIVAKHPELNSLDLFFDLDKSNEKQGNYTPSTETTKEINLLLRDKNNIVQKLATTTLNVSQSPTNPVSTQYFIHLGDSTVEGTSSSGIQGAIANELSRRCNGTGTALLSGSESPASDSFTNLQFIGTLGDQPIKHEGRGGWNLNQYLNSSSVGSVVNAFYNSNVSKFDLDYYLTENGFTNITASGDNLTIILQCTWNSVYNHTDEQFNGWLTEIVDLILEDKPSTKIVLVGVPTPPTMNKKTFSGDRNVSYESIMKKAVLRFSNLYNNFANNATYTSNVDFVSISQNFFYQNSYTSVNEKITSRHSETYKVYTDYVHQNALGYAQIADTLYYYILNKYC